MLKIVLKVNVSSSQNDSDEPGLLEFIVTDALGSHRHEK